VDPDQQTLGFLEAVPTIQHLQSNHCQHDHDSQNLQSHNILLISLQTCATYTIKYCSCFSLAEHVVHLGFWPSTPAKPSVAFSLDLLRLYRLLNLNATTSISAFCTTILGINDIYDRLLAFNTVLSRYLQFVMICI
jgi:hypothetical protein